MYVMLDFKLADGMVVMLNKAGEKGKRLRDHVNLKMEEAARKNKILKGRQIVWMVCESFKTHDRTELIFSFDHLSNLTIQNHDLHEFVMQWNHVLDNMGENAVNPRMLRDVFFRRIQHEKSLQ